MRFLNRSLMACLIGGSCALPVAPVQAQTLTPGHQLRCPRPEWPKEALRKEMTGSVTVAFIVTASGTAEVAVVGSSGWKVLDDATASALRRCTREPGAPTVEGQQRLVYTWSMDEGFSPELNRLLLPKPPGAPGFGPRPQ